MFYMITFANRFSDQDDEQIFSSVRPAKIDRDISPSTRLNLSRNLTFA